MAKIAEIFIEGEVYPGSYLASMSGVREQLQYQGQFEEIRVMINSHGGDISEGLGIYDMLRSYKVRVTTIVIGQCCSAATIIYMAGTERIIFENVVAFMVHQASGLPNQPATSGQLRDIADFIDTYNERMIQVYVEATKQSAEKIAEIMAEDTYMTAEQALELGFATVIAKPIEAFARQIDEPLKAKYYASRPLGTTEKTSTSINQIEDSNMKIIRNQAARIAASMQARLNGTITAKDVTTDAGRKLTISQGGESPAEGEPILDKESGKPLEDGTYVIEGHEIKVKDGVIDAIKPKEDASAEVAPTAEATTTTETAPATGETVTPTTETTTETPAEPTLEQVQAENTRLNQENTTLQARVTAMEGNQAVIMRQLTVLSGTKASKEIAVPQTTQVKAVTTATTTTSEDDKRAAMLADRKKRGLED